MANRSGVSEQETKLLALYRKLEASRAELKQIKEEKLIEKKNEVPLVAKPTDHGKNLTKEQLNKTIKNAQSYTEMAKKLAASGKLVINSSKSTGFKRRAPIKRQRPMDDDPQPAKPKFSLPNYADDNKIEFNDSLTQGEEMEFKEQKSEPKTQKPRLGSTSSGVDRSGSAPNNNRPRGGGMKHGQGRQNQQPKRQQIVYDEDPF